MRGVISGGVGGARRRPRILVAGLGNCLLTDDGVGVHAVRRLARRPGLGVEAVEVGTAALDAIHLLATVDAVVAIDAMAAGGAPGTVYLVRGGDLDPGGALASLHEVSLVGALAMVPAAERPEVAVVGVEPATIDYGLDLSAAVAASLPAVLAAVDQVVHGWRPDLATLRRLRHPRRFV